MSEWYHRERGVITEEKLLKAVHILAVVVEDHGPAFRPLYHDVRQQLIDLRQREQEALASKRKTEAGHQKVA